MNKKARIIAYYLPQYHPIPENDKWWGKGFTEWTNVVKAKPLFRGHYQPHIPADLGFYDLRLPIIREQQAQLAREAGIEGFCYWHYWFGSGKQLLEMPFQEVLKSGKPDFPFCLGWANESWSNKSWHVKGAKVKDKMLIEQKYFEEDYIKHFYHVLAAFKDKRYITVDAKPLFVIFKPLDIPDVECFINKWNQLARQNGLKGIHFIGVLYNYSTKNINGKGIRLTNKENDASERHQYLLAKGFNAINSWGFTRAEIMCTGIFRRWLLRIFQYIIKLSFLLPVDIYDHRRINKYLYISQDKQRYVYPTLMPNWDRSPRTGKLTGIYINSTPDVFNKQIENCLELVKEKPDEHKIIFLKSWNEWGEGNHVEPDLKYGRGFLNAIKENIIDEKQ
ncbi:hypothetical protein FACS189444_3010 [Spirochaetia bacterium]|nr:hypothetical protein FACS189444_3010 [Spirochaetia bacterium]